MSFDIITISITKLSYISKGALLILTFYLFGCNPEKLAEKRNGPKLPVILLIPKTATIYKNYVGDLNAYQNVEIRARTQGYLEKIYVDEGKKVKKGSPLFQLSNKELKANVSQARANLKKAIAHALSFQLELDRKRPLAEKEIISSTEVQVAEAEYQAAKAEIEKCESDLSNAETKLSYSLIKAPFDGITDRNPFKVGSLINEGALLTTVSDIEFINAYFNISERDYIDYIKSNPSKSTRKNTFVNLILADGLIYNEPGKLEKEDGVFDDNTGTIAFRAKFPNPSRQLKHGSTGTIQLTNYLENAIMVPQKATYEIQDKSYVFVVDRLNKVEMRSFIPFKRFADYYIVASGLNAGERIVYEGIQKVKHGMKIVPEIVSIDSLITIDLPKHK